MDKRLLYILLLISLAFNLAFVGSFLYFRHSYHRNFTGYHCAPGDVEKCGPKQFERPFPPPPRPPDETPFLGNRQILQPYRDKFVQSKLEFFQQLQKPGCDVRVLNQKLEASLQNHEQLEKQIGLRMIELRKKMTDEEARNFFGKHAERLKHPDRHFQNRRRQP